MSDQHKYDLVVIGSGPGGQKAAIAAAKLGKRVAHVERRDMVGVSAACRATASWPADRSRVTPTACSS